MKIMSVIFEEEDIEFENKMLIYKLFSKVSQENNIVFLTKIENQEVEGFLIFDKNNSGVVRKISYNINKILDECGIEYMVSLPMIMDGVVYKVPTLYLDGKIKIMR